MGARGVFDMVPKEYGSNGGMAVALCSCGALCVQDSSHPWLRQGGADKGHPWAEVTCPEGRVQVALAWPRRGAAVAANSCLCRWLRPRVCGAW
jgi:hypothetical protein